MILTITDTNDPNRALEGWAPPPLCEELVIDCPQARGSPTASLTAPSTAACGLCLRRSKRSPTLGCLQDANN
jgi:hypothetical protein